MACEGLDEKAESAKIREKVSSYIEAFNRHDPQAITEYWAEDAKYTNPDTGMVVFGRKSIRKQFASVFEELGDVKLEINIESITFPDDNTALEQGKVKLITSEEDPMESAYKVKYVKENGEWLISVVSEIAFEDYPSHYEQLKGLEWLMGEWMDEGEDVQIYTHYSWDKYKNFIMIRFMVEAGELRDLEGQQIVAWDPATEQIRSWMFDSDGGFGEGKWSLEKDRWVVELAHTLPDGRRASAINIFKKIDENSFSFESTGREIEGELLPNIDPVTIVRKKG